MTLTWKQQLAAAATLSVAAASAQAACTGGNSAGCSTAASQSGSAVAQANAEGGNASNKSYGLPSVVPGAPFACPTWTFTGNALIATMAYTRTDTECLRKLAESATIAKACEIAQGNTTESLRLRTQLAAAKVPETAELALRRDIGRLGAMGAQGLLQFCPGIKGAYEAAKKAEDSCGPGKQAGLFGDCDPIVAAEPPRNTALEHRLAAVEGERNRLQTELDKCTAAKAVDNSAPIKAILTQLPVQKICGGKGTLRAVQIAVAQASTPASGTGPQQCKAPEMAIKCVDAKGNEVQKVPVAIIPANAIKQLQDLGVTFAPGK